MTYEYGSETTVYYGIAGRDIQLLPGSDLRPLADPEDQFGDGLIRPVNVTCPQPTKNFAWSDGHWAIYRLY